MSSNNLRLRIVLVAAVTIFSLVSSSGAQAFDSPTKLVGSSERPFGQVLGYMNFDKYVEIAATGLPFESAARPVIQINNESVGQPYVGKTLDARTDYFGGWVPSPTLMTYQWLANGKKIRKAKSESYSLASRDVGKQITVRVVGVKESYVTTIKESDPTSAVSAGRTFATSSDPVITGSAVAGQILGSEVSPWSAPGQTVVYSYQWFRGAKVIKRATNFTYLLTVKDIGKRITVRWTGNALSYLSVVRTSTATERVLGAE